MRLLLIRHAQTPANSSGVIAATRPGPGLTELGLEQAAALPDVLIDDGIEAVYVSPLVRTTLTATPLAEALGLPIQVREGLEEIEAGDLEGRGDHEAIRTYFETVIAWVEGDLTRSMPGGPDGVAFFERFDRAIAEIAAENRSDATVAVISHGAAIRAWVVARAANPATVDEMSILDNTSIVVLIGSHDEGWRIDTWAGMPVGGAELSDASAPDPTGKPEA